MHRFNLARRMEFFVDVMDLKDNLQSPSHSESLRNRMRCCVLLIATSLDPNRQTRFHYFIIESLSICTALWYQ